VEVIVRLTSPQPGERCNDPACGTFGFMVAADRYIKEQTDYLFDLSTRQQDFQKTSAFTGIELVHDNYRIALMNALLHHLEGEILMADTLSSQGKRLKDLDLVLTTLPFSTKKPGERPTRDDLTFPTANKQLNFLQHIYRSLKRDGKSRAAVIVPDSALIADEESSRILADLMDKCHLHTVLRLPMGIFFDPKAKANVLFFTRGEKEQDNTKAVWFYDMRSSMLTEKPGQEYFYPFIQAYQAPDRAAVKDNRWTCFTKEEFVTSFTVHPPLLANVE
jgi:type I restriction enzyme M protein